MARAMRGDRNRLASTTKDVDEGPPPIPFALAETRNTLFGALLAAAETFGAKTPILEDQERAPLTYRRLILGALVLGKAFQAETVRGETVGVMLPNVNAAVVTLFGLSAYGRVPALLNFTAGVRNLVAALQIGEIETLVTSRRFIDQARLDETLDAVLAETRAAGRQVRVVYLEDVRAALTSFDKAMGMVRSVVPGMIHARHALSPDEAGVLLFTSGSEGAPKGVVLSNANLIANVKQIEAHIGRPPLGPDQIIMNPLPIFHSYGLTGGLLLGLLGGMKVVLYPSPLQYKQVARITEETKATILFGTDTFLRGWMRAADPGQFASVRIVVAGAERVKDETRTQWAEAGTTILEGYGATECSPVIAVNQVEDNMAGTVGRLLPGIEARLEPVEGIHEGGRLIVRGPNVMAGYIFANDPGVLVPPEDGWHDTGDIVTMDSEGRISIRGRAKRFAKIGGEMVSLAAIESLAQELWPDASHVAVAIADPKKGEQIALVSDGRDLDQAALARFAKDKGYPELWVPRAVMPVAAIPVLGSGKVDYAAVQTLVRTNRPLM
jgi:acyl-[acyl-carrier-protein]-phospholipid O-acyltransferase/long-chain-fatty-acid--[acyl-carrier-protein] ligase